MAYNPNTMSFDLPDTDMIYITGLPEGVTEKEVGEFFGSIGVLKQDKKTKQPKIWLYKNKETGALKGDGTVSYDDPFSAASAVQWFNDKEWKGSKLTVSLAETREGGGGGGGRGGRGGYGGGGYGGRGGGGRGGYGGRGGSSYGGGGGRYGGGGGDRFGGGGDRGFGGGGGGGYRGRDGGGYGGGGGGGYSRDRDGGREGERRERDRR